MNPLVTLSITPEIFEKMKDFYHDCWQENDGEYVTFQAITHGVIITGFLSKKERRKVTFMGESALAEAKIWDENASLTEPKIKEKERWLCFQDQIGSDEVGVGDFLLPMIVVAALVDGKDIKELIALGIHDSKKLTDEEILALGPILVKKYKFSKLTISNEKYNEMNLKGENLNSMKAKMHNRALENLHEEYPDVSNIFMDQFVAEDTYYRYLTSGRDKVLKGITFKTKGESSFPCVALASVIARYAFLLEKDKLEKKYHCVIPCGASRKVTSFAKKFLEKYGREEFDKLAKKNFANYREVMSEPLL